MNLKPRTIKLTIAYEGTDYAGWQRQPGKKSLQDTIEQAIFAITGEKVIASGSGRTDAGVHALGQVVSFHTDSTLSPAKFHRAMNAYLPRDIAVLKAEEAAADFHARKGAISKRYRYVIFNSRTPDVFRRTTSWHYCYGKLDVDAMHRAAQHWLGTHDFRSFETQWPQRSSSVRTVLDIQVVRLAAPDDRVIQFEVEADGFLYNMVRTMVGTLVEVGRGRRPESWTAEIVTLGDRRLAGMKVPAAGLFLLHVKYP
jgi:tRNA pseudouridine38-40 synthase